MKGFFNHVLASMLGTFLVVILLVVINVIIMVGVISSLGAFAEDKLDVKENSVLVMNFMTPVADRSTAAPNPLTFSLDKTLSLRSVTETIKNAKEDERIKGIFLDLSVMQIGIASVEEIRNALLDFKTSGKFIIAHAEFYTHLTYYLATVADNIYLTPEGNVQFTGLSAQLMFFKSLLDKVGVEPEIIRHGKFKSAVEPYMLNEASEANIEQTMKYVGSIWNTILKGIEEERDISVENLNMYADSLMLRNSKTAKTFNFVDDLKYKDQILDELKVLTQTEEDIKLEMISLSHYMSADKGVNEIIRPKEDKIAIIYAEGSIISGTSNEAQIIGSVTLSKAIRAARKDRSVKAIVLRVNSPGGGALASEVIWRETVLAADEKPFVVSMGDVAASGGYYIACMADTIVAQPNTITGSIGVFGLLFNAKELMSDVGVNIVSVNTNNYSDLGSPARKMSTFERAVIKQSVEEIYSTFITHVSEGRKLSVEYVDSIGQGRVWSGIDAFDLGLVDVMGGLETAIDIAAKMAKLEEFSVKNYPQRDKITLFFESMLGEAKASFIKEELGNSYIYYKRIKDLANIEGVQARMPYYIDLK